MAAEIRFVFFDVGNTLLFPNRARIDAPLTERGMTPDKAHLRDLERRTKNSFDSQMARNGSTDKSFWWMFYAQLLAEIGVKDEALLEQLVSNIRESGNWDQMPSGTRERLEKIAGRYRIAVISNADGRIEDVLHKCGIADCFLSITDSGLVGHEKPHPEIFRRALESLKARPEESLYVGDVYSVDYLGANGAGMQAMLMDVSGAYQDMGVARVESLEELTARLTEASNTLSDHSALR